MKTKSSHILLKKARQKWWGYYAQMHQFKKQYTFDQYINFCLTGEIIPHKHFKFLSDN